MSSFIEDGEQGDPYVFIQWKGTDVCMDFHCDCGAHCHFDGYFAYKVKCPHCETLWEMPCFVKPRKSTAPDEFEKLMEPDEDFSEEFVDLDGVTKLKPHPVPRS